MRVIEKNRSLEPNGALKFTVKVSCSINPEDINSLKSRLNDKAELVKLQEQINTDQKQLADAKRNMNLAKADLAISWFFRGLKYEGSGDWEKAVAAYSNAIENLPSDAKFSFFYEHRAICYYFLGDIEKAKLDCEKILEVDSNDIESYNKVKSLIYGSRY
jgi:Tetratricopeptide repeat.